MIVVDIIGNRFLYNMVRIIIGTLLDIERNNENPEYMEIVLNSHDRNKAGKNEDNAVCAGPGAASQPGQEPLPPASRQATR